MKKLDVLMWAEVMRLSGGRRYGRTDEEGREQEEGRRSNSKRRDASAYQPVSDATETTEEDEERRRA